MPVVTDITQLSTTAASNYPAGTENANTVDDYIRQQSAFIAQLRDRVISVKDYGATGDGVTDDVTAIQAALDAGVGSAVYFPEGVYLVSSELTYDATAGGVRIFGAGPGSVIEASGSTNKCLKVTGTAGITVNPIYIEGLAFDSSTLGTSAASLHLDGIAVWWVRGCDFKAGTKATYGIQCTAAQQGGIADCRFSVANGIFLEPDAGDTVHSNGIEIHGNTLYCSTKNIIVDRVDSCFIHSNHLTTAPLSIDVLAGGFGTPVIRGNHIESHTTAGVRSTATPVTIDANNFFHGTAGIDVVLAGSQIGTIISNNLMSGDLDFGASVSHVRLYGNAITNTGTFTNNSTLLHAFGNYDIGGSTTSAATGAALQDKLSVTSREGAGGAILTLNPNSLVDGHWGMKINGAGSNKDIYIQFNDYLLAGNTTGGSLVVKTGVGGTTRATFDSYGVRGTPMIVGTGTTAAVPAGCIGIGGSTSSTVGAAGGASALPATPSGYIVVNIGGTNFKVPYYAAS